MSKLFVCYNDERKVKRFREYGTRNARNYFGVAFISPDYHNVDIDVDNKVFIINYLSVDTKLFFPMDDKSLMKEFFKTFKEKLNMTKKQFELLINL